MEKLLLRGYVSPEDFVGTDAQRIQKAFDTSKELDVGRVVLQGEYAVDKTLYIHPMTDLVLENAFVKATGDFPVLVNRNFEETEKHSWSFQDRFLTIRGNGCFGGDVILFNADHVTIDGPAFQGMLRFSFTSEVRLYNCSFTGTHGVFLTMGCNNYIMQNLTCNCTEYAVMIDATEEGGDYVIGKESDIHEIILQDSHFLAPGAAVRLLGGDEGKIYNMQFDHLTADHEILQIGSPDKKVSEDCYFNLTAELFESGAEKSIVVNNPVKHCYFPG